MKSRKYLSLLFALLLLLSGIPLQASTTGVGHTHDYVRIGYKAPTCQESGYEIFRCSYCQREYSNTLPATGHDMSSETLQAPTCTEEGKARDTCRVCGTQRTRTLRALGHDFDRWKRIKEPTCSEEGLESSICRRCGVESTRPVAKLPHQFGEWKVVKPPSLNGFGIRERKCVLCGAAEQEKFYPLHLENDRKVLSEIQKELHRRGYRPGRTDGRMDDSTRRSLQEFQNDNDLEGDGEPLASTMMAMGIHLDYPKLFLEVTPQFELEQDFELLGLRYYSMQIANIGKGAVNDVLVHEIFGKYNALSPMEATDRLEEGEVTLLGVALVPKETYTFEREFSDRFVAFGVPDGEPDGEVWSDSVEILMKHVPGVQKEPPKEPAASEPEIYIYKVLSNEPGGRPYLPGDTIEYSLYIINETMYDMENIRVVDYGLDSQTFNIDFLPAGSKRMISLGSKKVTEDMVNFAYKNFEGKTIHVNTATLTYTINGVERNKAVSCEAWVDKEKTEASAYVEKFIENTPANGEYFVPGETIRYGITVHNESQQKLINLGAYDYLFDADAFHVDSLAPFATETYHLGEFVLREEHIRDLKPGKDGRRYLLNHVTLSFQVEGYNEYFEISAQVNAPVSKVEKTEETQLMLAIQKFPANKPKNGAYYTVGEELKFIIVIAVNPELGLEYFLKYLEDKPVHYKMEFNANMPLPWLYLETDPYVLRLEDITNAHIVGMDKYFVNTATLYFSVGGKDYSASHSIAVPVDNNVPIDPAQDDGELHIHKFVRNTPARGFFYVGETIEFGLEVTNNTDKDIYFEVNDDKLDKQYLKVGLVKAKNVLRLPLGSVLVREGDINSANLHSEERYFYRNIVDVKYNLYDKLKMQSDDCLVQIAPAPVGVGPEDPPQEEGGVHIEKFVLNTPARGFFYVGETIEFALRITNNTNDPIDFEVKDEKVDKQFFTNTTVEPGTTKTIPLGSLLVQDGHINTENLHPDNRYYFLNIANVKYIIKGDNMDVTFDCLAEIASKPDGDPTGGNDREPGGDDDRIPPPGEDEIPPGDNQRIPPPGDEDKIPPPGEDKIPPGDDDKIPPPADLIPPDTGYTPDPDLVARFANMTPHCERILESIQPGEDSFRLLFCTVHSKTAQKIADEVAAAANDRQKQNAYKNGIRLWIRDVEDSYDQLIRMEGSDTVRKNIEAEHKAFRNDAGALERLLILLYGKQSPRPQEIINNIYAKKSVELCYLIKARYLTRKDTVLQLAAEDIAQNESGAGEAAIAFEAYANHAQNYHVQTGDTLQEVDHKIFDSIQGINEANAAQRMKEAGDTWHTALEVLYSYAEGKYNRSQNDSMNKSKDLFEKWLTAYRETLQDVYEGNEALIQDLLANAIKERLVLLSEIIK